MMQPTHLKFGVAWGLLAIPIAVYTGLVPSLGEDFRYEDMIYVLIGLYACLKGALFGSEFPDTDHPTSIPARKHPLLAKIYIIGRNITGESGGSNGKLKKKWFAHRGIMSHDYLVHLILWGTLLFGATLLGNFVMEEIATGNNSIILMVYVSVIIIMWSLVGDVVNLTNYVMDKLGTKFNANKLAYRLGLFGFAIVIVVSVLSKNFGGTAVDLVTGNLDLATASLIAMWFFYAVKLFIIFTFVGCVSHLFGDMITVSGVYLATIQIKPMSMFKILTKIPGLNLAFDGFRTGGPWEKLNNGIITVVIVPAAILAVMSVFGWNIDAFVELPNFIKAIKG